MRARFQILLLLVLVLGFGGLASAQQVDAWLGLNALMSSNNPDYLDLRGGLFPQFGGDVIFFHGLGVGADVAFRASQSQFCSGGNCFPYRPLFYDFNAVWQPLGSSVNINPVLEAGIGAQSTRFYSNYYNCSYFSGCSNYQSKNQFAEHLSAALRIYITPHIFIAPQAQFYFFSSSNQIYNVGNGRMFGIALGYSLRATPF